MGKSSYNNIRDHAHICVDNDGRLIMYYELYVNTQFQCTYWKVTE